MTEQELLYYWSRLVDFHNTILGEILMSIVLVALASLSIKVGGMFVADKVGIIQHLTKRQMERLKAIFDLIAMSSNIGAGIAVSILYDRSKLMGCMYALGAILLHWYIESGLIGKNISFIFKYGNPKQLLKRWVK